MAQCSCFACAHTRSCSPPQFTRPAAAALPRRLCLPGQQPQQCPAGCSAAAAALARAPAFQARQAPTTPSPARPPVWLALPAPTAPVPLRPRSQRAQQAPSVPCLARPPRPTAYLGFRPAPSTLSPPFLGRRHATSAPQTPGRGALLGRAAAGPSTRSCLPPDGRCSPSQRCDTFAAACRGFAIEILASFTVPPSQDGTASPGFPPIV